MLFDDTTNTAFGSVDLALKQNNIGCPPHPSILPLFQFPPIIDNVSKFNVGVGTVQALTMICMSLITEPICIPFLHSLINTETTPTCWILGVNDI